MKMNETKTLDGVRWCCLIVRDGINRLIYPVVSDMTMP